MEYENFDSHLDEFENSDEMIDPSDAAVDSYLDFENEEPECDALGYPYWWDEPEIRRIHLDAFPFDE